MVNKNTKYFFTKEKIIDLCNKKKLRDKNYFVNKDVNEKKI